MCNAFGMYFLGRVSFRMVGKDGKVESKREVVKQGYMVKRSQNKKRFTPINYKQRWFVLTRYYLAYYDSDGEVSFFKSFYANSFFYLFS